VIYLTTGGNGAGKTLITLKDVRDQQLKENRPVYFHGFRAKQVLLDWGWQEFDPKKWQDLPDGSICVMDECQNEFPAKVQGELPDYINAVAQHRRRRGFDFWMITPHPSLIHVNIRRLIESPSWHRHLKRTFGADMVSELRFNFAELKCEQPSAGNRGQVSMRAYPKEVYNWYESASLHTGKKRLPKQVWILAAALVIVPALGYFAYSKVMGNVTKGVKPATEAGADKPTQAAPVSPASIKLSVEDWLQLRKPRLTDFPHTAPAYDEVTKPAIAPYPAACVQKGMDCLCYTQQATLMQVSGAVCLQIVKHGFFVDWKQESDKAQQQQDRRDFRQVAQNHEPSTVRYEPPAVRSIDHQAQQHQQLQVSQPESAWARELARRNAEVVSTVGR
jgi:zona occludens toxin